MELVPRVSCILLVFFLWGAQFFDPAFGRGLGLGGRRRPRFSGENQGKFARVDGTRFTLEGHPLYINGFNAYWVTYYSYDLETRPHVTGLFRDASGLGLNVARAWGFNDGAYHAIQSSPGVYNEQALQGLDFVIAEARSYNMMLILSLSNNYKDYGGRPQYAQWARDAGHTVGSDDDFFSDAVIRGYYKDYIKMLLTRVNSITGVAYRDDPTIFAWELMNEPRCSSDPSGNTLQAWVEEMASFVKSIDSNHLLEVGSEGFYSTPEPELSGINGWSNELGTDFIRNSLASGIDFASMHCYPDFWLPQESFENQVEFMKKWIHKHVEDASYRIEKPVLLGEFGKSNKNSVEQRDRFFGAAYRAILSGNEGGARSGAGGLFWQLVPESLEGAVSDGFEVVPTLNPSTTAVIAKQSQIVLTMSSRHS